jgi:tRNA modification GTPase
MIDIKNEDTITAIATPGGLGAISVIRISGNKCFEAADKLFRGKSKLADSPSHTIHYGRIFSGDEVVDDVLVSVFRNPNSYTGEDSIEISTHGSPYICEKIISLLLLEDVRLAEPGEFTKRAFLNGRIDLVQAEAVADVINSRTEASLRGARNQLDGLLSAKVESLRNMLVNTSSLVELELDFAEEDVEFLSGKEVLSRIDNIILEIDSLLRTYTFGRVVRDGVNVALVGKPNVGKSSLLNYLLKESRAIVSEIPGTTRDVIREDVSIGGILFRLYDTAGIRITEDKIEKEGVLRSRQAVKEADLVFFINDPETGFAEDLYNELTSLSGKDRIVSLLNKVDLITPDIKQSLPNQSDILISSRTGEGIDKLVELMKDRATGGKNYSEKTAVVSNLRHYSALERAKQHMENAKDSINQQMTGEFISVDLRNAENSLDEIIGKVTTDDILNNIFTRFCIGK